MAALYALSAMKFQPGTPGMAGAGVRVAATLIDQPRGT
jgi:hypothetical protein